MGYHVKPRRIDKDSSIEWVDPQAKQGVDQRKRDARVSRQRGNIKWKFAPAGASMARQAFPAPYQEPPNVDPRVAEHFVIGRPVAAVGPLTLSPNKGTYLYAPLAPFRGPPEEAPIPKGSLLIYTGPVREEERKYVNGKPHNVYAIKHTFITPLGRCIIHDFNLISLIGE